jgi:hypothetical protein
MKIETMETITRAEVRAHPHKVFLFGDNLAQTGLGGQAAEMRGEPNAVGIPTKKLPTMNANAFFTDDEYTLNVASINRTLDAAIDLALRLGLAHPDGPTIVLPSAGLGTGRAQLKERAPKTFAHLQQRIETLKQEGI